MKVHVLFPLIALAAGLGWIGYQNHRIDELGREAGMIREAIGAAQRADSAEVQAPARKEPPAALQAAFQDHRIHWDRFLELRRSQSGAMERQRLKLMLRKQFTEMTTAEVEAEFDRFAALEIPESERREIMKDLIEELSDRDPGWLVQRLFAGMKEGDSTMEIRDVLKKWIAQDLTAATGWIDAHIHSEGFGSKSLAGGNSLWADLENQVFPLLCRTDPAAAAARIKAMPEDLRVEALSSVFERMKTEDAAAFIEARRAIFPGRSKDFGLYEIGARMSHEGLDSLDRLIAATNATPGERSEMVNGVLAEQIGTEKKGLSDTARIDELEAWGRKQAPEEIDRLMASILAGDGGDPLDYGDFRTRADLALRYARNGNSDRFLADFLNRLPSHVDPAEAAFLLERISDEALREDVKETMELRAGH